MSLKDITRMILPPIVIFDGRPTSGSLDLHVRISLPSNRAIEFSDIFVFNGGVRREVHSCYSQRRQPSISKERK